MTDLMYIMGVHNRGERKPIRTGRDLPVDPKRIPIGIFSVDMLTGGGIPLWQSTCAWGSESGGKTSLCLSAVASAQRLCWRCFNYHWFCTCSSPPMLLKVYWGEVENTLDRAWAESMGVDPDAWVIGQGETGEEHLNIARSVMQADDVGLVVLDSLAALSPQSEMDADFEDQFMGKQAALIGRAVRVLKQQMIRERRRGHPCALLFTNQMRMKIGQMFGSPESMSGGCAMKHDFSLLFRCGKKALDTKRVPDKHYASEEAVRHSVSIQKSKIFVTGHSAEYVRVKKVPTGYDKGPVAGRVDDFKLLAEFAKQHGIIEKNEGKGYKYHGQGIDTMESLHMLWANTEAEKYYRGTQFDIVQKEKDGIVKRNQKKE